MEIFCRVTRFFCWGFVFGCGLNFQESGVLYFLLFNSCNLLSLIRLNIWIVLF